MALLSVLFLAPLEERFGMIGFLSLMLFLGLPTSALVGNQIFGAGVSFLFVFCFVVVFHAFTFAKANYYLSFGKVLMIPVPFVSLSALFVMHYFGLKILSNPRELIATELSASLLAVVFYLGFRKWLPISDSLTFPYESSYETRIVRGDLKNALAAAKEWAARKQNKTIVFSLLLERIQREHLRGVPAADDSQAGDLRDQILGSTFSGSNLHSMIPLLWTQKPFPKEKLRFFLELFQKSASGNDVRASWKLGFILLHSDLGEKRDEVFRTWMGITEKAMKMPDFLEEMKIASSLYPSVKSSLDHFGIWLGESRSEY